MLNFRSLLGFLIFILCISLFSSCIEEGGRNNRSDDFNRTILLESFADRLIVPAYQDLSDSIDVLYTAKNNFTSTTNLANLIALRKAFEGAYVAWQYAELYRFDPEENNYFHLRMNTFPASVLTISNNISTGVYNFDSPANDSAQGFPTLDYLLNGVATTDEDIINLYTGAESEKRIEYLSDVVNSMKTLTNNVLNQWNGSYRNTFVASNGNTSTSSTNELANSYLFHLERYLRANKIMIPASLSVRFPDEIKATAPQKIEAYYSNNLSRKLFDHSLQASENFFLGNTKTGETGIGFDDYLVFLDKISLKDKIINSYLLTRNNFESDSNSFRLLLEAENVSYFKAIFLEFQENIKNIQAEMFSVMSISSTDQGVNDGD